MIDSVEIIRFFTEFTLSGKERLLASLRVTVSEGFRMTNIPIPTLRHSLPGERIKGRGGVNIFLASGSNIL